MPKHTFHINAYEPKADHNLLWRKKVHKHGNKQSIQKSSVIMFGYKKTNSNVNEVNVLFFIRS